MTNTRGPIERDRVAIELGLVHPYEGYVRPLWKRSKRERTVHHYECPRARTALAWFWPMSLDLTDEVSLLVEMPQQLKPCKICFDPENIEFLRIIRVLRHGSVELK